MAIKCYWFILFVTIISSYSNWKYLLNVYLACFILLRFTEKGFFIQEIVMFFNNGQFKININYYFQFDLYKIWYEHLWSHHFRVYNSLLGIKTQYDKIASKSLIQQTHGTLHHKTGKDVYIMDIYNCNSINNK